MKMRKFISLVETLDEYWTRVNIEGYVVNVGWNIKKNILNKSNHNNLGLNDGIEIIFSSQSQIVLQFRHGEERELITGRTKEGNVLVVCVVWVDTGEEIPSVRIVSVRYALKNEVDSYKMNEGDEMNNTDDAYIDPDNPPLSDGFKTEPYRPHLLRRLLAHKAKWAEHKKQEKQMKNSPIPVPENKKK